MNMRLVTTALAGLASLLLATSASAQIIQACAKKDNGQLRIVSAPTDCLGSESPLAWNAQGPPGPMGEPGQSKEIGEVVRIELPATSGFDTLWFVPTGKALLTDHIAWSDNWINSNDPMEVSIRHFINISGGNFQTTIDSTTGFLSFQKPLVLPAHTGLNAPDLNNSSRTVYIFGRLVDADSALLSGTD